MCDVKKYSEIYKDIKALQPEDTYNYWRCNCQIKNMD